MSDLEAAIRELVEPIVDERLELRLQEFAPGTRDNGSPWLTVTEAAKYLRTSERTVQRILKRGRIRTSVIGRRRLLHRDDLDAFMRATTGEDVAPTTSPRRRGE